MNKKFYSFGMAAMMLLLSGNVMATDYYISANGNDANDGKSAATALATLTKLASKLANGDHVFVSGIIKVKNVEKNGAMVPEWNRAHLKGVVFEGVNPQEDGFDGEGENQLFNLNNSIYTFKNLSFRNGKLAKANLGKNNDANTHAAAIWGTPLRLTLDNCIFEGNVSEEDNNNNSAGAVYVGGGTVENSNKELVNCGIYATNTQFIQNTASNGQGGAIQLASYGEFKNCYFKGNEAANAGGAIHGNSLKGLMVDGCAFEANESQTQSGGAINFYLNNVTGLTFQISNSTFSQNKAARAGGAFSWNQNGGSSDNTINFVHCTVADNTTAGNVGSSGGINIANAACSVNIINSLIQGNLAATNANSYADITFGENGETKNVTFKGSCVGYIRRYANYSSNYTVDDKSKLNTLDGKDPRKEDVKTLLAYADYDADSHIYRLKATSDATTAADLSADATYGVTTDQLGQAWTKPYVGAVQLLEGESTGISGIKTDAPKSLKGIYNIAGQYVGNDASQLAKGLYIINGKKVIVK